MSAVDMELQAEKSKIKTRKVMTTLNYDIDFFKWSDWGLNIYDSNIQCFDGDNGQYPNTDRLHKKRHGNSGKKIQNNVQIQIIPGLK